MERRFATNITVGIVADPLVLERGFKLSFRADTKSAV